MDDTFGLPTVSDILKELEKPGRDPRPAFRTATFKEGVEKISDLSAGMVLEGVVTNVAAFGAFVDVGVHQDGLVHVSAMSKSFVKDPRDVVKPGDIVKVKVLDVDIPRKRIALTLRLDDEGAPQVRGGGRLAARQAAPVRPAAAGAAANGRAGAAVTAAAGRPRRRPTARWRTRCAARACWTRRSADEQGRAGHGEPCPARPVDDRPRDRHSGHDHHIPRPTCGCTSRTP